MSEKENNLAIDNINKLPQLIMRPYYTAWKRQTCGNCDFWRKLNPNGVLVIGDPNSQNGHCCVGTPNIVPTSNVQGGISAQVVRVTVPANYPACGSFLPNGFVDKLQMIPNNESK